MIPVIRQVSLCRAIAAHDRRVLKHILYTRGTFGDLKGSNLAKSEKKDQPKCTVYPKMIRLIRITHRSR